MARPSQIPEVGFPTFCSEVLLGLLQEMERAGERSDGDVDDDDDGADDVVDAGEKSVGDVDGDGDGDGCGEVGFRNFYQYSRHLLGPWDDSVEDVNIKWLTFE